MQAANHLTNQAPIACQLVAVWLLSPPAIGRRIFPHTWKHMYLMHTEVRRRDTPKHRNARVSARGQLTRDTDGTPDNGSHTL
ncbi:hypothetical protein F5X99DRAFT_376731 [Biscogniauxia marginata]|nr:hypothetical protein F5X99DRAFT_376731 [Biscogniauxia marginata]